MKDDKRCVGVKTTRAKNIIQQIDLSARFGLEKGNPGESFFCCTVHAAARVWFCLPLLLLRGYTV